MTIKRKNIKRVINTLKHSRDMKFRMHHYMSDSDGKWSGCVGGFAFYTAKGRFRKNDEAHYTIRDKAAKFLGLNEHDALQLFVPSGIDYGDIKRKHAIKVLKYLRKTGLVDWSVAGVTY